MGQVDDLKEETLTTLTSELIIKVSSQCQPGSNRISYGT